MKTAKTWIKETLSPELAAKAIKNSTAWTLKQEWESFERAIEASFLWEQSPEGHDFWSHVRTWGF